MDCRAASTDLFIDYFVEIDLPAVLSALGTALTLVMPVNHESDSVDQIQRLADQFGKQCGYVVVRNAAHSDSFALFESSEVRAQLKDTLGGREIPMSNTQQPIFDEEFDETVAEWRDKHLLREDDAVMLLVELFRIHQRHWDEIRRREMPSFELFRGDIGKLVESAKIFQQQAAAVN